MSDEPTKPRLLIIAYACEPGRGSEPGAGWGPVRAALQFARCTVLVGPEHSAALRAWQDEHRDAELEIVEVPEPVRYGLARAGRIRRFALYLLWLRRAQTIASDLVRESVFDVAWHLTYSAYWLPSPVVKLGLPSVWGPVGGAVTTPWGLLRFLGPIGVVVDLIDRIAVRTMALVSGARATAARADVSVAQNGETRREIGRATPGRIEVLNHALLLDPPAPGRVDPPGNHLLWVGALESRKGPRLAVHALAQTPEHVALHMVGDGPESRAVSELAQRLGVEHRLTLLGRVDRSMVFDLLRSCAAAVFTGLREEGGLALAEAMYCGTPVIVLDHGGAGIIARATVDRSRVQLVPPGGAAETVRGLAVAMTEFASRPPRGGGSLLGSTDAIARLRGIFDLVRPLPE